MPKDNEEVLELDTKDIVEEGDVEAPGGDTEGDTEGDAEKEVLTVQIGDEEPEVVEETPEWVKEVRRQNREQAKRIKELESKLSEKEVPADDDPGPEPKEEDYDFDSRAYADAMVKWHEKKRAAEARKEQEKAKQAEADRRWQAKLERLQERKKELGAPDIEEVEEAVRETLSITQQGIIVQGAKDPAVLFYALGKNPKKMAELAKIDDAVEFAGEVFRMEAQLKVGKRSSTPPPEKGISGRAGTGAAVDNTLERLREKAAKTGDMSEVIAYKRKLKERA